MNLRARARGGLSFGVPYLTGISSPGEWQSHHVFQRALEAQLPRCRQPASNHWRVAGRAGFDVFLGVPPQTPQLRMCPAGTISIQMHHLRPRPMAACQVCSSFVRGKGGQLCACVAVCVCAAHLGLGIPSNQAPRRLRNFETNSQPAVF